MHTRTHNAPRPPVTAPPDPPGPRAGAPRIFPRAPRRRIGLRAALAAVLLGEGIVAGGAAATESGHRGYLDAELRAILFNRAKAETLAAPVVLLAHRTDIAMQGNGARERDEHFVWFIGDPADARAQVATEPAALFDRSVEAFSLERCRVFRGPDTLQVDPRLWQLQTPRGWPDTGSQPWTEIRAPLPQLAPGDVVEFAYRITNRWTGRVSADWERVAIRAPDAPTIERHIAFTHNRLMTGRVKLSGTDARLLRHYGRGLPRHELLTGNLPPAADDPASLAAPCVLFTSSADWGAVHRPLTRQYLPLLNEARVYLAARGDSLARAHPDSRDRYTAIAAHLATRCASIPGALPGGSYYPRSLVAAYQLRTADPLERALLTAALAQAARLMVDVYLARASAAGFDAAFCSPMQFDRALLRCLIAEEDRHVVVDPRETSFDAGVGAVPAGAVLLGIYQDSPGLFEIDARGDLTPWVAR